MSNKINLDNLASLKNIRDIIILGRFSDEGDDNRIIFYGFADPNQSYNQRKLQLKAGDEGIHLVYTGKSNPNLDLLEPVYPVIKSKGDFIVAGNGAQTEYTRNVINAYWMLLHNHRPSVKDVVRTALREELFYDDVNNHSLELNSFMPDNFFTPRIQGVLYAPYVSRESEAAFAIVKPDSKFKPVRSSMNLELRENEAKLIATTYGVNHVHTPITLNFSGWKKSQGDEQEYQKKLTDLIFECLGPNAVGVASMMGYLDRPYIVNRIED